jgi:hypothetical protein
MSTEPFKLKNILYGLIIPLLVGIVIVLFPAVLRPALDSWFPPPDMMTGDPGSPYAFLTVIFTHGFALMAVSGIPLFLGLLWNKWAGGAAGFLTGTLYYIANAGYNIQYSINNFGASENLYADPSFIGSYIVGTILVGYIAGALNNQSMSFKRMLGSALTATLTLSVFQFVLSYTVAYSAWMTQMDPLFNYFVVVAPLAVLGVIVPILAKVFMWYGLIPGNRYQ